MWTLDHLADLESDFSAIHGRRIDIDRNEWDGLTGPQFFRMAYRMAAYKGVIRAHVENERERVDRMNEGATPVALTPEMVAGTAGPASQQDTAALATLIDFG